VVQASCLHESKSHEAAVQLSLLLLVALSHAQEPARLHLTGPQGIYSKAQWKKDWPGCEFEGGVTNGRVELVKHDEKNWLRVNFAIGEIGPEKGGAGWRFPIGKHDAAELKYTLRFSRDFDFVKGGKLPGLCGGPENISGGRPADGSNGFSARLMWRKGGRGEAYVYHKNQPERYGESFAFPEDFRIPTDAPVRVRMRLSINTPGKRDGTLRVWIRACDAETNKERLVVERTDMEWRGVDTFSVDSIYFETFHGGSDTTWAPARACWAEFGEISHSTAR
jgi:hypothetical protein